jgi:hypothetical protein
MSLAYRWKKTLGDVAERPGSGAGGYYSNDGWHHEYLLRARRSKPSRLRHQLRMSHKEHVPLDQMDEYVQDALDRSSTATAPPNTKWGALRAKAATRPVQPEVFGDRQRERREAYQERYPLFHDAIKKRYPEMHLILDYVPCKTRPSEIVDEHYYNTPEFFMRNAGKYDAYDRAATRSTWANTPSRALGARHLKGALARPRS